MQTRWQKMYSVLWILMLAGPITAYGQRTAAPINIYRYESESSGVRIYPDVRNGQKGITAEFAGTADLHYYATEKSAPAPGLNLQVRAEAAGVRFLPAVYPAPKTLKDPALGKTIQVFAGDFKVFVPAASGLDQNTATQLTVHLSGIACTSKLCLMPFKRTIVAALTAEPGNAEGLPKLVILSSGESAPAPPQPPEAGEHSLSQTLSGWKDVVAGDEASGGSMPFYFLLAVAAGLSINVLPCVLPILPLIIMRLVSQAKESGPRRMGLGLAFCGGIVLFFAVFTLISVIVTLSTGAVIDLNSLYRQPTAVIVLFLLIVFFALVFLDVVTISVPSSLAGRQKGLGAGFAGSVGMGFFAALLSTPCSGALLGAVLVWAQSQPLYVSSAAIVLMGVGMALPYAVLVSIPKLLDFVPRPGRWMELFKKTGGFLLLILAVKFTLSALTKERLIDVLMYGVIFGFCVWMWGQWVSYNTPAGRKWGVRLLALGIAVGSGFWLLPANKPPIVQWTPYDPARIEAALQEGRPVLLKFTADWCTNCKVVEKRVYQRPEIAKLIEERNFLPVLADTTQAQFPASIDFKAVFGEAGNVPVTILLNPSDKTLIKLRGIFDPAQFKEAAGNIP